MNNTVIDNLVLNEDNFEKHIIYKINKAIENKLEYTFVDLFYLGGDKLKRMTEHPILCYHVFSPQKETNVQKCVSKIYNKIKEKYWNEYKIGLFFTGKGSGSEVSIENTNDTNKLDKILLIEENKKNKKIILDRCLLNLASMNKNDKKLINLKNISMVAMNWPFIMRQICKEIEPFGTIILENGFQVKKL